jgi:hypothetical protein
MSQSTNSSTANNNIKVEYHYGPRNSKQILYNNNLFGYFRNDHWRCINKKRGALISKEPTIDLKDIYDRNITAVIKKRVYLK